MNCDLLESLKDSDFIQLVNESKVNEEYFLDSYNYLEDKDVYTRSLSWLIILCCGDMKDLMSRFYKGNSLFELIKLKLPKYKIYFDRIKVENLDYKRLIKKYDSRRDVFFYCDPPYKNFEKYYYNHNFDSDEHYNLYQLLTNIKSNWILSYYKFDELEEWYANYQIKSKKHNLSEEYLIINRSVS